MSGRPGAVTADRRERAQRSGFGVDMRFRVTWITQGRMW